MIAKPHISICIPVYNMADCIIRAIQSACEQNYENFEILVVDNQSTDSTFERATSISDSRLKVFKNETNLGAYGNHNRCLELSAGDWIKFLHGDDELLPNCLTEFVKALQACPENIALIACGAIRLDQQDVEFHRTEIPERLFIMKKAQRDLTIQGNMIGTPTMTLIHKERFRQIGWFDRSMEPASDGDAWINLMKHFPSAILPQYLVKLRDDPLDTVNSKARLATKFCNQIFRQIDKWHQLDPEQKKLPIKDTDYGRWACNESFPYWSAAFRYAFFGEFCLLNELFGNLRKRRLLIRSFLFFLMKRLFGKGLYTFKKRVWLPEMSHYNVEYKADNLTI